MKLTKTELEIYQDKADQWIRSAIKRIDKYRRTKTNATTFINSFVKPNTQEWNDLKQSCFEYAQKKWNEETKEKYGFEKHFSTMTYYHIKGEQNKLADSKYQIIPYDDTLRINELLDFSDDIDSLLSR